MHRVQLNSTSRQPTAPSYPRRHDTAAKLGARRASQPQPHTQKQRRIRRMLCVRGCRFATHHQTKPSKNPARYRLHAPPFADEETQSHHERDALIATCQNHRKTLPSGSPRRRTEFTPTRIPVVPPIRAARPLLPVPRDPVCGTIRAVRRLGKSGVESRVYHKLRVLRKAGGFSSTRVSFRRERAEFARDLPALDSRAWTSSAPCLALLGELAPSRHARIPIRPALSLSVCVLPAPNQTDAPNPANTPYSVQPAQLLVFSYIRPFLKGSNRIDVAAQGYGYRYLNTDGALQLGEPAAFSGRKIRVQRQATGHGAMQVYLEVGLWRFVLEERKR
ncbi:hypothetical protein C8R43DRAFT_1106260 [Mycena crocata]|nr:hypothetical protein C8R43DRAFT_1106260 [Mycena crocata]